ncbi:MFS transporter [Flavilitoribacter nigricans]|nr:MFS transporter [Flavilitoribacter nigricans]
MQQKRHRWALNAMFLLNGFSYGNWISRLPRFQEIYDLDNGGIGLILLSHAVGALIAMPITGVIIARVGSRRATIYAAWSFLFWMIFIPLAPNVLILGTVFFCMGLSGGMLDVSMNAQAVLVEQVYKKPIMTSFHAVFSLGMMLGAGCGALFIRLGLDIMPHIYSILVLCVVLAWYGTPNLIVDRVRNATAEGGGFQLPNRALIGMGLIAFCCMLGEGAMADWSTNYLEKIAMAAPATAPLGLAAFSMAMMVARFLGDGARARWGDGRLLIAGSFFAALGLSLILAILEPVVIIIACMFVGLGLSVIVPIAYSKAGNMPNIEPGVGISMVTTVGYSGFLFGPPIIGFIADWVGLRIALGVVLVLFVLMLFLSTKVPRTARTKRALN